MFKQKTVILNSNNISQYCCFKLYKYFTILLPLRFCLCFWSNKCSLGKHKGHCTQSPKFLLAVFHFFVFPIPSYQNGMQRMRKRRKFNLIWFFFDAWKFRSQCANVIDTTWGRIWFLTCKNFGRKFLTVWRDLKGVLLCSFTKSWFCFGGVLEHALVLEESYSFSHNLHYYN